MKKKKNKQNVDYEKIINNFNTMENEKKSY